MFLLGLLLTFFTNECSAADEGTNVAQGKPVIANADWSKCLVDGDFQTTISPDSGKMPLFYVDLLDLYELSSIRVHAQDDVGNFGDAGINVQFSVYTLDKYTTGCDLDEQYPWKLAKGKLKFTKRGEEIPIDGPISARYIIIMPDDGSLLETTEGLTMGELRAFGKKVSNGYTPKAPDDGPSVTNTYTETRRALLSGAKQLWVEQRFGEYKLTEKYDDVALAWYNNKINTMAVIRQKARLVLMSGTEGLNRLISSSEYTQLKSNFLAWLSSGTSGASLVKVTAKYKDGDVLLITRDDTFNVASVQQSLTEGKNSAIIAYAGSTQQTADSATELMNKLEIGYSPHRINYAGRNLLLAPFIETTQFIPKPYVLQLALQSWKYFRTVDLVSEIEPEESAQPAFQEALTKLIEKHKTFFTETAICDRNQYVSDDDTEMAYENYNRLLLLQNGSSIEVAPGYARAPGSVLSSEKPTSYTVKFNVDLSGSFYPMGGYAKPGEAFRYKVLENSATDLTGFRIRINPQTDVVRKNVMKRWFVVTSVKDLENEGEFASPFGGPIVIEIPAKGSISIRFENVYRYAWFDLRDTKTMNSWETDRKKYRGVPFVMVVGNDMISMLDTSISTTWDAERLKWCTNYFDNVIKIMHNYRGTDSETDRMQVFVTDMQLSAGWGHSGYPWMGYVPWTEDFGNIDEIKKGHIIGIPHEIGHNLQVQQITFINGTEVSNNAYIPVAHYYLLGLPAYTKGYTPGWSDDDEKELLALWRGNKYIGVGVSHYNYFARSFSPALVGNVMNEAYHANTSLDKEEDKVNFWIQHLCSESGHDLVPFNRMWHFPISDETVTFCGKYPCFFPEDELTAQVPDLVKKQLDAYGKTCSRTKPNDVAFKNDIKQRIDKLKSQIIFIEG